MAPKSTSAILLRLRPDSQLLGQLLANLLADLLRFSLAALVGLQQRTQKLSAKRLVLLVVKHLVGLHHHTVVSLAAHKAIMAKSRALRRLIHTHT